MRTGRPAHTEKAIVKNLQIPESVCAQVEVLLNDPVRNKPKYGAFSQLVTQLLKKWLAGEIKLDG